MIVTPDAIAPPGTPEPDPNPGIGWRWVLGCFALFVVMGSVWALMVPRFAQPDEPAHIVRAAGVVRGEWIGIQPTDADLIRLAEDRQRRANAGYAPLPQTSSLTKVSAPASLVSGAEQRACYARQETVTPDACPALSAQEFLTPAWTWQGSNPPWIHAVFGLPTLFDSSARSVWWMRGLGVVMTAGLLTAAAAALRRVGGPALMGFLVAFTPTVAFLAGGATPNGVEITSGIAVFAGLVALWRVPTWLPSRHIVGVAAITLALARPIGPVLLAVAVLTIVTWGGSPSKLFRLGRGWLLAVGASVAVAATWTVSVGSLTSGRNTNPGTESPTSEVVWGTLSRVSLYLRQGVGVFDADRALFLPIPLAIMWASALVVVVVAVRRGRRQDLTIAALAIVAAVALPVAMEAVSADSAANWWRGRYQLPLVAGVALLAAVGRGRWYALMRSVVSATFIAGHASAVWLVARRYGAGGDAPLWFIDSLRWEPPLPAVVLVGIYLVAVVALVVWVQLPAPGGSTELKRSPSTHASPTR